MIPFILTCVVFLFIDAPAFSTTPCLSARLSPSLMRLGWETAKVVSADVIVDKIDDDITCYVVNNEGVITE